MKVLQINAVNNQLSTGRNAREIDALLCKLGHNSAIAYASGERIQRPVDYLIGGTIGQKMHALLSRITGLQGYYSSNATRGLLRYIGSYKPDVVMLGNLHANYIHLPMLLSFLAEQNIPTVAVLHDCWFYTGNCCHYLAIGCNRWQESCGNCPARMLYNKSWFFDRSKKMLRDKEKGFGAIPRLAVVAVSDWMLEEAKKAPVFQNAAVMKRIYNWVDESIFAPRPDVVRQQLGLEDKQVILCAASIWGNKKGLETVLSIGQKLLPQEKLVIVGQLPKGTQLPNDILHFPQTDDMNWLSQLYNLADVFIQPSLEETFGKVTAEALACGTPVVCFDSTANPELVGPGCGAVVPAGNEEAMLTEVRRILKNGKRQYTQQCCDYARKHFSCIPNMKQYIHLFEQLQTQ